MSKAIKIKKVSTKIISFTLQLLLLVLVLVLVVVVIFVCFCVYLYSHFMISQYFRVTIHSIFTFYFSLLTICIIHTHSIHYSIKAESDVDIADKDIMNDTISGENSGKLFLFQFQCPTRQESPNVFMLTGKYHEYQLYLYA